MKVFWFFFSKKNRLQERAGRSRAEKKALLFEKRSKNFYSVHWRITAKSMTEHSRAFSP
jgi:hypothetical protein